MPQHPYINRPDIATPEQTGSAIAALNRGRDNDRPEAVLATYFFETAAGARPLDGLVESARMVLEHGTLKPWHAEGDCTVSKPAGYDNHMSWVTAVQLLRHDRAAGVEAGTVTVAWPLTFFQRRADRLPSLATLFEAVASEPVSAFTNLRAARLVDLLYPPSFRALFPGQRWPHRRVREYLGLDESEPLVGTIVKPKTGLTPELFARAVVEAARAGARFTKADENMHLSLEDVSRYVGHTVRELTAAGFDLGTGARRGTRFLFAPHITADPDQIRDYAAAAVDAGANALMFTPYYAGGHVLMAKLAAEFDIPVYAHTAGMNMITGSSSWGIDPRVFYVLSGLCGAAFMQLPTTGGYIRPFDVEKGPILESLAREHLDGSEGMTLAIAGGLGPDNIAANAAAFGTRGRMFLAGTSVYAHPEGPAAGVRALVEAYREATQLH